MRQSLVCGLTGLALLSMLSTGPIRTVRGQQTPPPSSQAGAPAIDSRTVPAPTVRRSAVSHLDDVMGTIQIDGNSARSAFTWWSRTTGVSLVMDWDSLSKDGIDPEKPIHLTLVRVTAGKVLRLLMQQTQTDDQPLIYQACREFVQIVTKAYANKHPVLRLYEVSDLLVTVPNFENVPQFDLTSALSSGGGGGSGSGAMAGTGLFGQGQNGTKANSEPVKSPAERGEELAKLIRDTIEPTIWSENGGASECSIHYFNGALLVRAPLYVQSQIGIPLPVRDPEAMILSGDAGK